MKEQGFSITKVKQGLTHRQYLFHLTQIVNYKGNGHL